MKLCHVNVACNLMIWKKCPLTLWVMCTPCWTLTLNSYSWEDQLLSNNVLDVHLNTLFEPAHEIWIHIACASISSINMHVQLSSVDRGHDFWRKPSSTSTFCGCEKWRLKRVWIDAQTRLSISLLKTAVKLYHNLMRWLIMLHVVNNAFGRTGSHLGVDDF